MSWQIPSPSCTHLTDRFLRLTYIVWPLDSLLLASLSDDEMRLASSTWSSTVGCSPGVKNADDAYNFPCDFVHGRIRYLSLIFLCQFEFDRHEIWVIATKLFRFQIEYEDVRGMSMLKRLMEDTHSSEFRRCFLYCVDFAREKSNGKIKINFTDANNSNANAI